MVRPLRNPWLEEEIGLDGHKAQCSREQIDKDIVMFDAV